MIGKAAGPNSNQKQETGNISNQELPKKILLSVVFLFYCRRPLNTQAPADVIHAYFSNNKKYTPYLKIHNVHISAILDLFKNYQKETQLYA